MRKLVLLICLVLLFLIPSSISAQGLYRPFGIGFRTGIWKYRDAGDLRYQAGTVSNSSGGMVYFFARLVDRWYLEASIGGVSRNVVSIGGVENINMTPLLFGARYDLLSKKYGSIFQPYLALGGGMYTINRNIVAEGKPENVFTETILNETYQADMIVLRQNGLLLVHQKPHSHTYHDILPNPVLGSHNTD